MNEHLNIYQDNELINAAYSMTIDERRLLMIAMSRIDTYKLPNKNEPMVFDITIDDWNRFFGTTDSYSKMKRACKKLKYRDVQFKDKNYTEDVLWCDSIRYIEGEGRIRLRFGWTVSHYLTGMYEQFTKTNLLELQHLSSNHSVRIYEMCAQFRSTGYKIVNISDLKRALCLEDKYKLFGDFRVKVIEPSIAEINKNTDLRIKVNYLKKGRAFDRIEFIIKEKPRKAEQQLELDVDDSKKDKHATRKKISDIQDTDW